ncbi:MAG: DsbA family protein [Arcobacter sp.]|nr:MAG: DsbA family protein [Arcobacter sp.]
MIHTLYYVYDPMCSWCYAFAPTFEKVKIGLSSNIKIVYVPGGLALHSSEPMPQDMKEKLESIWYEIESVVGTKFNHDFWTKCTPRRSTYLACQATLAAKAQNKEEEMIKAIQSAYYQRAMNPSDEDTMVKLALELNLDIELFKKDLYSSEIINKFEEKMNLRRKLQLNSFPSLAIEYKEEIYPINIKYNEAEKILQQIKNLTTKINF